MARRPKWSTGHRGRSVAEGKRSRQPDVNECMTKSVRSVKEDTLVAEVLSVMSSAQIRRVPVVNASDELVGIVSIGDISTETNQDGKIGQAIEQISQGPSNKLVGKGRPGGALGGLLLFADAETPAACSPPSSRSLTRAYAAVRKKPVPKPARRRRSPSTRTPTRRASFSIIPSTSAC